MSETIKVNGLCRCCLTEGEFRSLGAPYRSDGSVLYSALLRETLNITINPMPGPENAPTYTICDGCTSRLQDAAQFRNQVLKCETKFAAYVENYLRGGCSFSAEKIQIEAETLQDEEIEHIKEEIENVNSMKIDDNTKYLCEQCKRYFPSLPSLQDHMQSFDNCDGKRDIKSSNDSVNFEETINTEVKEAPIEGNHTERPSYNQEEKSIENKTRRKGNHTKENGNEINLKEGLKENDESELINMIMKDHIILGKKHHDDKVDKASMKSVKKESKGPDETENYINEFDSKIEVCDDGNRIGDARHSCDISSEIFCRKDKIRSHVLDNRICSQDSRDSGLSCDRTFNRRRAEYHCTFCTDTFAKLKSLKSHELAHTEKSGFICDYCRKSFNDKIKLRNHIIYHAGNYTCEICGHFSKTASDLKVHIRNVHEKIRAFKCDLCPKTYQTKRDLIQHRSVHTGVFPHKCDVCLKSFRFQSGFICHKNRHLLKSIKPDEARIGTESRPDSLNKKCPICGKSFKNKSFLRQHLNTHTKPFKCDVCGKSFSKKPRMVQHQKQHDPGERETKTERKNCSGNRTDDVDYSCDFCKQIFCGKEKLRSHLLAKHMSLDPHNISCPSCGIKFKGRDRCLKHLMLHKTAQYDCDFCIDTFPTLSSLRTHEETHTKKSGYTCDYCQRGLKDKKTLIRHIKKHNMGKLNHRQYECETCGFITTQGSVFIGHAKAVHENVKPFKCDLCPNSYTKNNNLLEHKRIVHAGVFRYKCDVCSQRFRSRFYFNKHKLSNKHVRNFKKRRDIH